MNSLSTIEAIKKYEWPYHRTKVCEITLHYKCNIKCVFCYSSPELDEWKNKNPMLISNVFKDLISSYQNGSKIVQFIGGEPTIYPELDKAILFAKKKGYKVIQIVTNGQKMADPVFAERIKKAGLNSASFSIHHIIPQKHDETVQTHGAFKKTIKGIENAIKNEIYVTANIAITALNYKHIPDMVKFLYDNYGIETYSLIAAHFIGIADKNSHKLKVSYSDIVPYVLKTLSFLESKNILPVSPILSNFVPCVAPGCEHIISDWQIPFNDDDLYLPEKSYKNSMYLHITNTLRMKTDKCKKCIYFNLCAGFEKSYYKIFGGKEFEPIKTISKPVAISPFYKH